MYPRLQFHDATVVIGADRTQPRYFGSGFLVANIATECYPYVDEGRAETVFLVTARHVIARALHEGAAIFMRVPRYNAEAIDIPLPSLGWAHAESGADISVLPLPALKHERRDGGLAFPVIARDQFLINGWWHGPDYELGDETRLVGLWYGSADRPQLIVRSGTAAMATETPLQFESGMARAYLLDASVTPGMSGGPAYLTSGSGWSENALMGIIFGYWPYRDEDLIEPSNAPYSPGLHQISRELLRQVQRLNTQLVVVTPVHELGELLVRSNW